ncbi:MULTISPECIES: SoxR reducing system RseC family protein [unclassified Uliginosibacterium]|jgi:sigma-E factor negative regulatory protein RseC|uniref:SoxR reducing system RseC family protein n=1 Tax=unclassified Uliginosibacterium TaxID=2621521 RepID=UPI000C7DA7B6|nr:MULTISPECIES: SoxR reducing system RseC family protein [unclassified Uliginosibacterium]MDO6388261.1 SoxR reducing system RseC family protein [Uliginosibacterium sp. 31-12]PLK47347.1 transcriptional regulator [Uliginosibacterium sp. TH139]
MKGLAVQAEGVVVRCEERDAVVQVQRSSGCGRCHEPGGCGGAEAARCSEYRVGNPLGAQPGQRVLIEVPEGSALRAAGLGYGLPLAGVLGGAFVGMLLLGGDVGSALGGLVGLALGFGLARCLGLSHARRPRIAGVLS